jgi:hypothetical protein
MGFGLKVRGVAVQPLDTAMRCEVRLLQNAPDARPPQGPGVPLPPSGHQVGETPARGGAMVCGRFTCGHRHHSQTL